MQIRAITAKDLSASLREAIDALCARAYGQDLRGVFATFADPIHVVGLIDRRVVSHALWVTRWLQPNDGPLLRTAYVEAVATDPLHQRRGYASAVLRTLMQEIAGFQLAALCAADDAQTLYARLGWEPWQGPLFIRQANERISTPGETVMVHRLGRSVSVDLAASLSAEWRLGELW